MQKLQAILFEFFDEGVFIYEQIRNIEIKKSWTRYTGDGRCRYYQRENRVIYKSKIERSVCFKVLRIMLKKIETCMGQEIWEKYTQSPWHRHLGPIL